MINFLNLKYFLILSEEMNFRKAAHKLYITQQSLSGHIQKLEEYFGVPLFYRSTPLRLAPDSPEKQSCRVTDPGKRSAKRTFGH